MTYLSDAVADVLVAHRTRVTLELLECSCGWYIKRGDHSSMAHALHVAAALSEGGLI